MDGERRKRPRWDGESPKPDTGNGSSRDTRRRRAKLLVDAEKRRLLLADSFLFLFLVLLIAGVNFLSKVGLFRRPKILPEDLGKENRVEKFRHGFESVFGRLAKKRTLVT